MPPKRVGSATALARRRIHLRLAIVVSSALAAMFLLATAFRVVDSPPHLEPADDAVPDRKKIAFLFIARAGLPLDFIWDAFFRNAEEGTFTVYVHSAPGFELNPTTTRSAFFYHRQLARSIRVSWGEPTMIEAERLLFRAALSDRSNRRFVLLSDSCVPLYNFTYIYSYMFSSHKSFVDSFLDTNEDRYNPKMSPTISEDKWRKGSQWVTLIRKHAEMVVADQTVFKIFKKHCKVFAISIRRKIGCKKILQNKFFNGTAQGLQDCIPDEHYVQTLFSVKYLNDELERRTLTYTSWNQISDGRNAWHPKTFEYVDSSHEGITKIKGIDNIYYESEKRTEWCHCNSALVPCFLFARKFTPSAAMNLLSQGLVGPFDPSLPLALLS